MVFRIGVDRTLTLRILRSGGLSLNREKVVEEEEEKCVVEEDK